VVPNLRLAAVNFVCVIRLDKLVEFGQVLVSSSFFLMMILSQVEGFGLCCGYYWVIFYFLFSKRVQMTKKIGFNLMIIIKF
jgi:hypothetical protein